MSKLVLKSEAQIIGGMAKKILAKTGLNDLNPGSILLTLMQAAAQEDFAQYYQMLQIIRNYNLDTTTGTDLDNRAFEYGITRALLKASSGTVDILREATFIKISTSFYTGFRSRISGDTQIFVNNAAMFPSSGPQQTLIIGRGTPNEEEVTYTPSGSNPQNNTNYYLITLDVPLSNDHSLEEAVILKQGTDTFIRSGTVVIVPASGRTPQISFTTTVDATILAGDDQIDNVNVICGQPGSIGNIGVNAITGTIAFTNPPFVGARAVNDSAFSNGQDKETDTSLRNRIKSHIQALTQSTKAGIKNAIDGLVDADTAKRVVSSNIILPDNVGLPVKIYIDDGTGFEPDFEEQGEETIVSSAQGGEVRLQLDLFPLVKAQVETLQDEPFDMSTNSLTLNVDVGNQSETITFFENQFTIPEAATAEEVVKAINNNSNLLEARTADVGERIVINAKTDINEDIQVTGGTANARLNFSTNKVQTFYLYKNDKLLSKDGETALIDSAAEPFDFSGADQVLSVTVDGKTANVQTATIHQSDFTSPSVAAAASADAVAVLINVQIAGATASSVNGKLRITSNTELSSSSKIKINTSAGQVTLGYSTTQVVGKDQDYTLNPELGIIELVTPLVKNDLITAGTRNTRAFLTAATPQNYAFAGGETLKIVVDAGSTQTITFAAATNQSAQNVADFINETLVGGTAVTRTVGINTYLEVRTNTLDDSGSIEILSSSTSNSIFAFTADVVVFSILPHTAYQVAQNSGPYAFVEGNTLVIVLDNDNTGKTFVITMDYDATVTSGTDTTHFGASLLTSVFPEDDSIKDFWVVFKDGGNTISGSIQKVDNPTTNTFRYFFKDPPPTNFSSFTVGDQATFASMDQAANNGNFLLTGSVVIGTVHNPVITKTLSNPVGLAPSTGDRYLISPDAASTVNANSVIDRTLANPGNSAAVTVTLASPAVFTSTGHGLDVGNPVIFSTTGALPTGLTVGTTYYVIDAGLTANAFEVSLTPGGSAVNTSGSQSGAHKWSSPGVITPALNDRHIIAPGANNVALADVKGRYADSANTNVQEVHGYRYIVNGTGLNAWVGHNNEIAQYNGIGTPGWLFITPNDGDVVLSEADSKLYQFNGSAGYWVENDWGSKAGKIATWNGSAWTFTTPLDKEVRTVTSESKLYQYSNSANTWSENDWGGNGNKIAQWTGSAWTYEAPATNDTVLVNDETQTYQFNGTDWIVFSFWLEVNNSAGVTEAATASGTGLIGQRRQITAYNSTTGAVTLAAPTRITPTVNEAFILMPGTRTNAVTFFNNTKVTSLSTKADIELVDQGQKIQISSLSDGSDGYVQITGGRANDLLQFSNSLDNGLRAYAYYIGLIKLVHSTVYGDEQDLVSFPGVGATGVKFQILPPTVEEVGFSVNITLADGVSLSSVENDITTQIISYVNSLGVADEVILSNIASKILTVQGVVDVVVTSPSTNVIIANNELARSKASLIAVNVVT